MSLEKLKVIDQISADEHGNILYRENTRILEDGVVLSEKYHRSSLSVGASLVGVPEQVAKFAQASWNPGNVAAFSASFIALQNAERDKQAAAVAEVEAQKTALIEAQAQHDAQKAASEAAKNAAAQKQAEAAAQTAALDAQLATLADARNKLAAETVEAVKG